MACELTPERRAELEANLTEARAAYHNLITGKQPRVIVDQNGERVEFTAANRGSLYQYIQELEMILCPPETRPSRNLAPMGFTF